MEQIKMGKLYGTHFFFFRSAFSKNKNKMFFIKLDPLVYFLNAFVFLFLIFVVFLYLKLFNIPSISLK